MRITAKTLAIILVTASMMTSGLASGSPKRPHNFMYQVHAAPRRLVLPNIDRSPVPQPAYVVKPLPLPTVPYRSVVPIAGRDALNVPSSAVATNAPVFSPRQVAINQGRFVVNALGLSDLQRQQFRVIRDSFLVQRKLIDSDPTMTPRQRKAAKSDLLCQERQALEGVLSPDQRDKLNQLRSTLRPIPVLAQSQPLALQPLPSIH